MQTFLPYASFEQTATVLDWKRLGKQRLEGRQITKIITTPDYVGAWAHHPAVKMWRGYENALKLYVNTLLYFDLAGAEILFPAWLGDPRLHDSHKSNLLRKYPEYYRNFHWNVPDDLPYFWPVK